MKNVKDYHFIIFQKLGIDTRKPYELCVEAIIQKYLDLNKFVAEIEEDKYRHELYNLKTHRQN